MRMKRTKRFKRLTFCRLLSVLTAASLMFTNIPANVIGRVAGNQVASLSEVSAATDYGLADNIQDGTILHCFNWKYKDIEAELANIAAAGFTSIQTSPAQRDDSKNEWYMLYQPQSFSIYTNALGTKSELQSLCTKADEQYGINVIVDVVANHTRSVGDDGLSSDCYHDEINVDYSKRYDITHGRIGMPDLKSESVIVQNKVKAYIKELIDVGVDGIRWDAAKHISLPSEDCQFWPVVTSVGIYNYGEILVGPVESGGEGLMKEYTNYMSVTDSVYGKNIRLAFEAGSVPDCIGNWSERGISKDKLVYWGESHDTYSNNGEYGEASQNIDQNKIDRAYAVVAAQNNATSLYFSRPFEKNKPDIKAGAKGSTHFTSPEVAKVNHFHNAMVGQKEYYVGDKNNNIAAVCREKGAVVVLGSGGNRDVSVANGGSTVAPGTYTDQVSGSTWSVTSSTISGKVGDSGIAVLYNPTEFVKKPTATISKEGGNFTSDTLSLTIGLKNATSGTYQIGNEIAKTFTGSTTITIGSGMAEGESVTVELTATDGTTTTCESYTFTKKVNIVDGSFDIYFTKPDSWGNKINCYAYVDEVTNNGEWPGVAMENLGDGIYGYNLPDSWTTAKVIFNDGTNQDPASQQPGLNCTNGISVIYENGSFKEVCTHNGEKELKNVVKATCTQDGYSGDEYCKKCGDLIKKGNVVAKTEHTWDEGTVTKQPTQTTEGEKTYYCIITGCNGTKTDKIDKISQTTCTHTGNREVKNVTKETCNQNGYTGDEYCKDCGTIVKKGDVIASTGNHTWDNGTITQAPTETTTGIKTYTCTTCATTKTETVSATGGNQTKPGVIVTSDGVVEVGDVVEDSAAKTKYRVTQSKSNTKTVEYVTSNNNAEKIEVPNTITINGTEYKVTSIANNAFKKKNKLKSITIGKNVKTIGDSAFYKCTSLTSLKLPSSVTKIGKNAFYGCKKLKSVTLSSKLTTIDGKAFYKCTALTSITIPSKVNKIGEKAFYGCKKLNKITINTSKLTDKKVGSKAFKGIKSKATIKVPKKKVSDYKKLLKKKGVSKKATIEKK